MSLIIITVSRGTFMQSSKIQMNCSCIEHWRKDADSGENIDHIYWWQQHTIEQKGWKYEYFSCQEDCTETDGWNLWNYWSNENVLPDPSKYKLSSERLRSPNFFSLDSCLKSLNDWRPSNTDLNYSNIPCLTGAGSRESHLPVPPSKNLHNLSGLLFLNQATECSGNAKQIPRWQ